MTHAPFRSPRCRRGRRRRRRGRARAGAGRRQARRRDRDRPHRLARPATGWSRWSRSRRRKGRVAFGPVTAADVPSAARCDRRRRPASRCGSASTDEIPWLKRQTRLTFARCGVIDPRSLEDYRAHGGYKGLERALTLGLGRDPRRGHRLRPARPRRRRLPDRHQVEDGGADQRRPQIHRLQRRRRRQRHLRRPHDHGRRSLRADRGHDDCRHRRRRHQGLHLHPLRISARGRGDERRDRGRQARRLSRRTTSAARRIRFDLEVRVGAGAYVCGEETSLLESLEGRRGIVRAKPPLPAHKGLFGKPTVINNVLSFAAIPFILAEGAKAYADFGMGRSRGTMPIQLAGNIKHGGLFETAFGITLGELVDDIGGGTFTGRPVRAVQVGGPLGAYFPRALFDTPFDYEAFAARDGLIGHGGIVVFDDTRRHGASRRASPWNSAPSNPAASARPAGSARPAASRPSTRSSRGERVGREPRAGRRPLQHHEIRLALRARRLHALPRDERAETFPGRFRPGADHACRPRNKEIDHVADPRNRFRHAALQIRNDGDADHRRPTASPCPRAPRSCARRWKPARKSRSSAPPTWSTPSAPAGSAWSRSRAAPARRPPAPRRS